MVFIRKRAQIKLILFQRSASELNIVQSKLAFEANKMRITMNTAIQFAAVVLVQAPAAAVTVFVQPSGQGISKGREHARPFIKHLFTGTTLS